MRTEPHHEFMTFRLSRDATGATRRVTDGAIPLSDRTKCLITGPGYPTSRYRCRYSGTGLSGPNFRPYSSLPVASSKDRKTGTFLAGFEPIRDMADRFPLLRFRSTLAPSNTKTFAGIERRLTDRKRTAIGCFSPTADCLAKFEKQITTPRKSLRAETRKPDGAGTLGK